MAGPAPAPHRSLNGILVLPRSISEQIPQLGAIVPATAPQAPPPPPRRVSFDEQVRPDEQQLSVEMEWDTDSTGEMVSLVSLSPPFSTSSLDAAREEERNQMDKACRAFLETGRQNGAVDKRIAKSTIITPYSWVKFREQIIKDGKLQVGDNILVTKIRGILLKCSNMKPICTFPSCFSTDMAPTTEDRRCVLHEGDKTSFCVMELVFKKEVPGHLVKVGIEHVNVMFSHFTGDTPTRLRERIIQEYDRTGQAADTWSRLHHINFKRAADNFLSANSMTVRRDWIFDDAQEASDHYYTVAMAAELVAKKLSSHDVIPAGDFKGQHLKTVLHPNTVACEGKLFTHLKMRMKICKKINKEQKRNYGMGDYVQMIWS